MKFHFMNSKGVINLEEVWKDIEGYEGLYQVSSWGRVRSVFRYYKILRGLKTTNGYLRVALCKNGKTKFHSVHRVVAQAFIPNPQNKPQVNHIDENKDNNHVENLEWCTAKENTNHGTHNLRVSKTKSKPIICIETGIEYYGTCECARQMGLHQSVITHVLKGKRKTTGGYTFKYKEE